MTRKKGSVPTLSQQPISQSAPITVPAILARKNGEKITALTAYDYTFARLIDEAQVDIILVGDSLASTMQGDAHTIPVTIDEMVYHCRCVSRAVKHALVVGDLPFLSYQVSPEQAITTAGRLLKEGLVSAVKLEGGVAMAETIRRLTAIDIPVMGHVGLTPQSVHRMGGYKVQGRSASSKKRMSAGQDAVRARQKVFDDARAVEQSGAFAVVLEGIPAELAQEITESLSIPTIGIGAGMHCDGQILVTHDMLGLTPRAPKFVKRYADLSELFRASARQYIAEVKGAHFPTAEHSYHDPIAVHRESLLHTTSDTAARATQTREQSAKRRRA